MGMPLPDVTIVEWRVYVTELLIAELLPALGVHAGPGTTGLSYFPVSN